MYLLAYAIKDKKNQTLAGAASSVVLKSKAELMQEQVTHQDRKVVLEQQIGFFWGSFDLLDTFIYLFFLIETWFVHKYVYVRNCHKVSVMTSTRPCFNALSNYLILVFSYLRLRCSFCHCKKKKTLAFLVLVQHSLVYQGQKKN